MNLHNPGYPNDDMGHKKLGRFRPKRPGLKEILNFLKCRLGPFLQNKGVQKLKSSKIVNFKS